MSGVVLNAASWEAVDGSAAVGSAGISTAVVSASACFASAVGAVLAALCVSFEYAPGFGAAAVFAGLVSRFLFEAAVGPVAADVVADAGFGVGLVGADAVVLLPASAVTVDVVANAGIVVDSAASRTCITTSSLAETSAPVPPAALTLSSATADPAVTPPLAFSPEPPDIAAFNAFIAPPLFAFLSTSFKAVAFVSAVVAIAAAAVFGWSLANTRFAASLARCVDWKVVGKGLLAGRGVSVAVVGREVAEDAVVEDGGEGIAAKCVQAEGL